ncbi:MAG: hypothetical protein Q4G05_04005, partial [Clostridia bacterium]|nr:hypothetical protein [Clostridia bacterium]
MKKQNGKVKKRKLQKRGWWKKVRKNMESPETRILLEREREREVLLSALKNVYLVRLNKNHKNTNETGSLRKRVNFACANIISCGMYIINM